jgi:hypothetical protein
VLTASALRRLAPQLLPEELLPLRAGLLVNPVRPSLPRVPVYFWKDVALLCMQRGYEDVDL